MERVEEASMIRSEALPMDDVYWLEMNNSESMNGSAAFLDILVFQQIVSVDHDEIVADLCLN